MLTNADIKKLKEVFATKDDWKKFATKDDLKNELRKELRKYTTKNDLKEAVRELMDFTVALNEATKKEIVDVIKEFGSEISSVLKNHEDRIQKLESKVVITN